MIRGQLHWAGEALGAGELDAALDEFVRALGLALQLGPAPVEQVLASVLVAACDLGTDGLAAFGPALVGLVSQVREAGALPNTPVMAAWAAVAAEMGALVGQAGVALSIPLERRTAMMDSLHGRAAMLDEATGGLFGLVGWLNDVAPAR